MSTYSEELEKQIYNLQIFYVQCVNKYLMKTYGLGTYCTHLVMQGLKSERK